MTTSRTVTAQSMSAEAQPPWWKTGVIYQIYPRSFQDTNGDGIGDLPGITSRLDYLTDTLGVDAIWISPFYPSPMADFGYDVENYVDVAPIFGTLADFDELVTQAHRRNLRIIIDFVPNHTSSNHPWFRESRSSRDNPKRDWYIWRDPKPDGSPPNNWIAVFGGPAWQFDETTGQYYLHMFLKEQPDLNWRNPEVKRAMLDAMRFWLDRGTDGFRIDVAHFIMKDPQLRDNPPNPNPQVTDYKNLGEFDSLIHVHDQGHPDVHDQFREIRRLLDSYNHGHPRMAVAEIHVFDYELWATYFGEQLDELHLPFNFGLIGVRWEASEVRRVVDAVEGVMRPGMWPTYVVGNHDEHRIASRVGTELARVVQMLLLTLRGTPTMYEGDELGMTDVDVPPELEQDPWGKQQPGLGLGRDPERTPMQWSAGANAGFCPPDVRPWLPVSDNIATVNVEVESHDPRSMLSLTRQLLQLRRSSPALHSGSYAAVDGVPENCFVYRRQLGGERKLILLNFGTEEQTVSISGDHSGDVELSTHLDRSESSPLSSLRLRPREGLIVLERT